MSYKKNEWYNGEVITADLLNHMEEGIEEASQGGGGGGNEIFFVYFEVTMGEEISCTTDTTIEEICEAYDEGKIIVAKVCFTDLDPYLATQTTWNCYCETDQSYLYVSFNGQLILNISDNEASEGDILIKYTISRSENDNDWSIGLCKYSLTPVIS